MEMVSAAAGGFLDMLRPLTLVAIFLGLSIGIIIGILPAIGSMSGMVLLLPFLYGLDPVVALPMLLALHAVSVQGGSITTILLGIPGDATNVPTLLDGFPMTRKGEAGRALGAALTASASGGMMGLLLSIALIPVVVPMVMAMHKPEMLFLVLVALSFLATLGSTSQMKGLIAGGLGLFLSLVGYNAATGTARFTFDIPYLFNGLGIAPVAIGLFAGAELLKLAISGENIVRVKLDATPRRQILEGMRDVYRHIGVWFRSVVIAYVVGLLPGIGATASGWMAYGQAKQTSKHPEQFGTGRVEGVIAAECSNPSCHCGDLLTTISFGIPGSSSMAILLAAFFVVGIQPGPQFLSEHSRLAFSMLWTNSLTNVVAAIICIAISGYLVRVAAIPNQYLYVTIMALIFISIYAMDESLGGIVVILAFSVIGLLMGKFDYSRPSLLLGFVLGEMFENFFWLSFNLGGPLFFMRPISLGLIALIIFVLFNKPIKLAVRSLSRRRAKL